MGVYIKEQQMSLGEYMKSVEKPDGPLVRLLKEQGFFDERKPQPQKGSLSSLVMGYLKSEVKK